MKLASLLLEETRGSMEAWRSWSSLELGYFLLSGLEIGKLNNQRPHEDSLELKTGRELKPASLLLEETRGSMEAWRSWLSLERVPAVWTRDGEAEPKITRPEILNQRSRGPKS